MRLKHRLDDVLRHGRGGGGLGDGGEQSGFGLQHVGSREHVSRGRRERATTIRGLELHGGREPSRRRQRYCGLHDLLHREIHQTLPIRRGCEPVTLQQPLHLGRGVVPAPCRTLRAERCQHLIGQLPHASGRDVVRTPQGLSPHRIDRSRGAR